MVTRRRFVQSALAAPFALSAAAKRPNVVLIFADDLGWGDLSCYGHPLIRTPHLDRMAAEGVRFTQYYSANPLCSPSRASLMTGRYHVRTGVNRVLFPFSETGLPEKEITIAQAIKPLGYATCCVGKWHLGHLPKYLPTTRGFDRYFGIPYSNDMSLKQWPAAYGDSVPQRILDQYKNQPDIPLMRDDKVIESDPDQTKLTPRYTAEATRFIRDNAGKQQPFFLYFPHTFPHVPLYASDRFKGKSARGIYGDAVEELDWSVGEVLRAISEAAVDNDTLVLFTSDNGPARMEQTGREGTGGSAGLLREFKGSTWEGGVREPFIARWPGKIPPGRVSHAFAEAYDIFPTIVKAAGGDLPTDREYDGADLAPVLLRNEKGREPLHFYYAVDQVRGVRKGEWKLHLVRRSDADVAELYNLERDPSERFNVAARHPDIVARLHAEIDKHKSAVRPLN